MVGIYNNNTNKREAKRTKSSIFIYLLILYNEIEAKFRSKAEAHFLIRRDRLQQSNQLQFSLIYFPLPSLLLLSFLFLFLISYDTFGIYF